jgi:Flp pilus assembly protein TadG
MNSSDRRSGERGAVSIKTILVVFCLACAVFLVMKFAPIYIEQRKVIYDVEEVARIAAVRGYKEEKITPELGRISGTYDLPEGSINFLRRDNQSVQIAVTYTRSVDLLVTTYDWKVEHTIVGKEL